MENKIKNPYIQIQSTTHLKISILTITKTETDIIRNIIMVET